MAAATRPWPCLPPAFDQGQRLHALPNPEVYWLEIMLRQHELCWRPPATPRELRVVLLGSSGVYAFPLPVEESFGALLNQHFAANNIGAYLFNLAFVTPYQVRDAFIIHEALPYEPDVIVYPVTLAEFRHLAPMPYPTSSRLFNMNDRAFRELITAPPPGLEEPFKHYATWLTKSADQRHPTDQLRDAGLYARLVARAAAESLAARLNSPLPRFTTRSAGRQKQYDCSKTRWQIATQFKDWREWNILAHLENLQRTRGIPVLVVHWPIANEPVDDCYSVRYTNVAVANFADWLRAETTQRNLAYLDLRTLLPAEIFFDSLHINAEGHRRIADAIAPVLDPILRDLTAQRAARESSDHQ